MLRDLLVNGNVGVDATYTADKEFKTGMAVVKDFANKLAKFPAAETGTDVVFVNKVREATGINAGRTDLPDYFEEFVTVNAGDKVVLYNYAYDNTFGTDQFDEKKLTDAAVGKYVAWGKDGLATVAAATTESNYKFLGFTLDAGKVKMARIYKTEVPGKNS